MDTCTDEFASPWAKEKYLQNKKNINDGRLKKRKIITKRIINDIEFMVAYQTHEHKRKCPKCFNYAPLTCDHTGKKFMCSNCFVRSIV